ncbi:MAG: toxin-antitoxin system antitoxin subunit [Raoultibacter sp.]
MDKKFIAEGNVEITDELLDTWAEPWERGEIPGVAAGFVSAPGRPRISEETSRVVSIRLPLSVISAMERKARRQGETRSQCMRNAIIADTLRD